jgi:hypothetical protein
MSDGLLDLFAGVVLPRTVGKIVLAMVEIWKL